MSCNPSRGYTTSESCKNAMNIRISFKVVCSGRTTRTTLLGGCHCLPNSGMNVDKLFHCNELPYERVIHDTMEGGINLLYVVRFQKGAQSFIRCTQIHVVIRSSTMVHTSMMDFGTFLTTFREVI